MLLCTGLQAPVCTKTLSMSALISVSCASFAILLVRFHGDHSFGHMRDHRRE